MTRRTLALTVPSHRQIPFAEYIPSKYDDPQSGVEGLWRIWQHFNNNATAGTYLELHPNGRVDRVTIGPDGNISSTTTIVQEL